jgi:hypothetical protein
MKHKKITKVSEIPHMIQIMIERWVSPQDPKYQIAFANFVLEWIYDLQKPYMDIILQINRALQDGNDSIESKIAALSDTVLGNHQSKIIN